MLCLLPDSQDGGVGVRGLDERCGMVLQVERLSLPVHLVRLCHVSTCHTTAVQLCASPVFCLRHRSLPDRRRQGEALLA